jgi:hypothetical protein
VAPIGVQLVKYVLHLLSGTGWPALVSRYRDRRGLGDENPPWARPPRRSPQRNGGYRRGKDNGHRDPHGAPPQ